MFFFIAFFIIAAACSAITIKTLVGYNDMRLPTKLGVSAIILIGWFSPLFIRLIQKNILLDGSMALWVTSLLYYLLGFCFILICLLFFRDIIWYVIYGTAKLINMANWSFNPKNISMLNRANVIVVSLSLVISLFAVYCGQQLPKITELTYFAPGLKKDMKFVQISDMHITRYTSVKAVKKIVELSNEQMPDAIFLTGDIIDDKIPFIENQLEELKNLKAKYGIFASIGNHELYSGINSWLKKFKDMGIWVLFNKGVQIDHAPVYVAGIPDMNTAMIDKSLNADFERALKGSKSGQYKILLSHNPDFIDYINGKLFDLQLSGHTHGGQIFPFHLIVKYTNKYLSGKYHINGVNLYVSNGAGFWGPQMRLLAPSEITVIHLEAKK